MNLGGAELLIVVAIVVLVFGAGWLPKAARNLGKAKVEMDKAQKQFNDTKNSVVEATGVKELEATISKANKALNSSPQKLIKDAAKSAATGSAAAKAGDTTATTEDDDGIEDAEIVEPKSDSTTAPTSAERGDDSNINIDFS